MPYYGSPLRIANRSLTSILIIEPTLGIDASQPSVDVPLGSTPSCDNYIMREGALEVREVSCKNGTPLNPEFANVIVASAVAVSSVTVPASTAQ